MEQRIKYKILGNISKEAHKGIITLKVERDFKNIDDTLNFLLNCYKSLSDDEVLNILNSRKEKGESIK